MLDASYWSPAPMLQALQALVQAYCELPLFVGEPGGGAGFPVDVLLADEIKGSHKHAQHGRVVLTLGDGPFSTTGAYGFRNDGDMILTWRPGGEAHIWAPAPPNSKELRTDAWFRLACCVVRALYERHHGLTGGDTVAGDIALVRSPDLLRHGQDAVVAFPMPVPVYLGRPIEALPDGSSIATVAPAGGAGAHGMLTINPEP